MAFKVNECSDIEVIKALFTEYSHIKGAESCFVSFDKELNDLEGFYAGGARDYQSGRCGLHHRGVRRNLPGY